MNTSTILSNWCLTTLEIAEEHQLCDFDREVIICIMLLSAIGADQQKICWHNPRGVWSYQNTKTRWQDETWVCGCDVETKENWENSRWSMSTNKQEPHADVWSNVRRDDNQFCFWLRFHGFLPRGHTVNKKLYKVCNSFEMCLSALWTEETWKSKTPRHTSLLSVSCWITLLPHAPYLPDLTQLISSGSQIWKTYLKVHTKICRTPWRKIIIKSEALE